MSTAHTELHRCFRRPGLLPVFLLMLGLVLLSGCTSVRYQRAPKKTPPAVLINLPSTEPPVEALLHTVIVFRGPGSWKRDAYWDEYVITVANRGTGLVELLGVDLVDFRGTPGLVGSNPWALERESKTLLDSGYGLAHDTLVQVGGGVGTVAVGSGIGALIISSSPLIGPVGAVIGGAVILPAFLGGTIFTNIHKRNEVMREFERRRLILPAALVPGQLAQGSCFFRISPGPRLLRLHCRVDGEPREVLIDLAPLSGLHIKETVPTKNADKRKSGRN